MDLKPFLPGQHNVNTFVWRPILHGMATLTEIMQNWTISDLYDAHEALDLQAEADAYYQKQAYDLQNAKGK